MQMNLSGWMRHGVGAVGLMVAACAFVGCGGDDDTGGTQQNTTTPRKVTNTAVRLNSQTAGSNGTAALNNLTFSVPSSVLAANATPEALKQTFQANGKTQIKFTDVKNADGKVAITNPTGAGTVKFASCTFTFQTPIQGVVTINDCQLRVNSNGVVTPTGPGVPGTVALILNGAVGDPTTATISLDAQGRLLINNVPTNITVTGTTGG